MPGDRHYSSPGWLRARADALQRDRFTCVVAGCGAPACVVDHIRGRRQGGTDALTNLRSLCRVHDNQLKEAQDGRRRSGGVPHVAGCDEHGRPVDPNHPWNRERPPTVAQPPANRLRAAIDKGVGVKILNAGVGSRPA